MVQRNGQGLLVTFPDPSKKVGLLMANRKVWAYRSSLSAPASCVKLLRLLAAAFACCSQQQAGPLDGCCTKEASLSWSLVCFTPGYVVTLWCHHLQLRQDFLYVEGVVKKNGTGPSMCFSSDQNAAMRVC